MPVRRSRTLTSCCRAGPGWVLAARPCRSNARRPGLGASAVSTLMAPIAERVARRSIRDLLRDDNPAAVGRHAESRPGDARSGGLVAYTCHVGPESLASGRLFMSTAADVQRRSTAIERGSDTQDDYLNVRSCFMAASRPHHHASPVQTSAYPADPITFAQLGVPKPLVAALARAGITEPFPIQTATLPDSLAGRDLLGRGRTGSGQDLRLRAADPGPPRRDPGQAPAVAAPCPDPGAYSRARHPDQRDHGAPCQGAGPDHRHGVRRRQRPAADQGPPRRC